MRRAKRSKRVYMSLLRLVWNCKLFDIFSQRNAGEAAARELAGQLRETPAVVFASKVRHYRHHRLTGRIRDDNNDDDSSFFLPLMSRPQQLFTRLLEVLLNTGLAAT